eukprot:7986451-Prorocentrum_lima.AAC.1
MQWEKGDETAHQRRRRSTHNGKGDADALVSSDEGARRGNLEEDILTVCVCAKQGKEIRRDAGTCRCGLS